MLTAALAARQATHRAGGEGGGGGGRGGEGGGDEGLGGAAAGSAEGGGAVAEDLVRESAHNLTRMCHASGAHELARALTRSFNTV